MQDEAFKRYLGARELADKTRQQRVYALKRIERAHGIDLDEEFSRDQLHDLVERLRYSSADARAKKPNPTRLDIEQDKLLTHLRWYLSHLQDYRRFKGAPNEPEEIETSLDAAGLEAVSEAVGQTFQLERDLQATLRAHLEQLESGLSVQDDGNEVRVEAGFIDILAKDKDGVWTVIELKADLARPPAIAQILAYMACVAAEKAKPVRGILVAGDHDSRVVLAARAVPNLILKKYRYRFEFE